MNSDYSNILVVIFIYFLIISMLALIIYLIIATCKCLCRCVRSGKDTQNNIVTSKKTYRDKIKELRTALIKQIAIGDGLTLLVGALSSKVDSFEKILVEMEHNIPGKLDEITNEQKSLTEGLKSLDIQIDNLQVENGDLVNDMNNKFTRIQRNFTVLAETLGGFSENDYIELKEHIRSELRILHDAIFVPLDNSGSDTEFSDGKY